MVADVQHWVNNPADNFGWILMCDLEQLEKSKRQFGSRESATAANWPRLDVQFTPPTPPLALTVVPQPNGQFQFQFNAESNHGYTVEFLVDLGATNWLVFTNIPRLASSTNVLISDPLPTDSNRFYRVRTP